MRRRRRRRRLKACTHGRSSNPRSVLSPARNSRESARHRSAGSTAARLRTARRHRTRRRRPADLKVTYTVELSNQRNVARRHAGSKGAPPAPCGNGAQRELLTARMVGKRQSHTPGVIVVAAREPDRAAPAPAIALLSDPDRLPDVILLALLRAGQPEADDGCGQRRGVSVGGGCGHGGDGDVDGECAKCAGVDAIPLQKQRGWSSATLKLKGERLIPITDRVYYPRATAEQPQNNRRTTAEQPQNICKTTAVEQPYLQEQPPVQRPERRACPGAGGPAFVEPAVPPAWGVRSATIAPRRGLVPAAEDGHRDESCMGIGCGGRSDWKRACMSKRPTFRNMDANEDHATRRVRWWGAAWRPEHAVGARRGG